MELIGALPRTIRQAHGTKGRQDREGRELGGWNDPVLNLQLRHLLPRAVAREFLLLRHSSSASFLLRQRSCGATRSTLRPPAPAARYLRHLRSCHKERRPTTHCATQKNAFRSTKARGGRDRNISEGLGCMQTYPIPCTNGTSSIDFCLLPFWCVVDFILDYRGAISSSALPPPHPSALLAYCVAAWLSRATFGVEAGSLLYFCHFQAACLRPRVED